MKNKKGFTLVELIIVIVIVGILSVISVAVYRGYTLKSKMTEGKALAASIITSQRVYYSEFGEWYIIANWVDVDTTLDVDARQNVFFNKIKTGPSSMYTNVISAEVYSEKEKITVYQFWPFEMNQPSTYPKWLMKDDSGNVIAEEW